GSLPTGQHSSSKSPTNKGDWLVSNLRNTGRGQELVKISHPLSLASCAAKREDCTLFRSRQCDEKRCKPLGISRAMTPPHLIIQTDEDHRVILKALALVDSHQWNLVHSLETIQTVDPIRRFHGASRKMQLERFDGNGESVSGGIFDIRSDQCILIEKSHYARCQFFDDVRGGRMGRHDRPQFF